VPSTYALVTPKAIADLLDPRHVCRTLHRTMTPAPVQLHLRHHHQYVKSMGKGFLETRGGHMEPHLGTERPLYPYLFVFKTFANPFIHLL
jgi:hypothetical protein